MDPQHIKEEVKTAAEKVDRKTVTTYLAGMATTPALAYIFRKPLAKLMLPILADEKLDEPLFQFMSERLNWRDMRDLKERRKREGTS